MPLITTTGTISGDSPGFSFLNYNRASIGLAFSGATLPTTLEIGIINDEGLFVPLTNGAITTLPTTLIVDSVPIDGLVINVTGGSPNFNLSFAGAAGSQG